MLINLNNHFGGIKISGGDVAKFLQGQLTNDVNIIDINEFQYSAYLNNKGRILASMILYRYSQYDYLLLMPTELVASIIKRLQMFVLRAKVIIEPMLYNIYFYQDLSDISKFCGGDFIINLHQGSGLLITTNGDSNASLDYGLWKKWLISHGIPIIYRNTQELFTPQQVNYDLLGGVNFKKGCYVGQEIVARMHYLGKIKRRMYRFSTVAQLEIGQIVVSPSYDNQPVGEIVEFIQSEGNNFGLLSVQVDCVDSIYIGDNNTRLVLEAIQY